MSFRDIKKSPCGHVGDSEMRIIWEAALRLSHGKDERERERESSSRVIQNVIIGLVSFINLGIAEKLSSCSLSVLHFRRLNVKMKRIQDPFIPLQI